MNKFKLLRMKNKDKAIKRKNKALEEKDDDLKEENLTIKPTKKTSPFTKNPGTKSKSKSPMKNKSNSKTPEKKETNADKKKPTQETTKQSTLDNIITSSSTSASKYPSIPNSGTVKIISWNICGLRPLLNSNDLNILIAEENPDIICMNETKIDVSLITKNGYHNLKKDAYHSFWNCSKTMLGYSGTAIFTKYEPLAITNGIGISKHDDEGRVITAEYPTFYLIACYTPNAGEKLKRLNYRVKEWDKDFFNYIDGLAKKKDIVLCGDLNVAFEDIDIYDTKGKNKAPGFTKEEKDSFGDFLKRGYIDTYRVFHKGEAKRFSFFSKRGKEMKETDRGWRLDYFVVNEKAKERVVKSEITDKNKYNASDHIPIICEFKI